MTLARAVLVASVGVASVRLLAQAPATGNAAVSGVVVDGTTRQPVANAEVRLTTTGVSQSQLTDPRGRFVFRGLPASSSYFLKASKSGYFDGTFGRGAYAEGSSGGIALDANEWYRDAEIRLERPASIAGHVADGKGRAIAGAYVRLLTRTWIAGEMKLIGGPVIRTDDRGAYRVPGLTAGTYLVAVNGYGLVAPPAAGEPRIYPTTFLGGARVPSASTPITIAFGEERVVSDIVVQPVTFGAIRGYVRVPDGAGFADLSQLVVRLVIDGDDSLGIGGSAVVVPPSAEGLFEFRDVPSGSYLVEAVPVMADRVMSTNGVGSGIFTLQTEPKIPSPRVGGPVSVGSFGDNGLRTSYPSPPRDSITLQLTPASRLWGRTTVTVDRRDVNDLVVQLRAGASISGQVVYDAERPDPNSRLSELVLVAEPSGTVARVDAATGTFQFNGLQPGRYFVRQAFGLGGVMTAATWNGRDYLESGFDTATDGDFTGVTITLKTKGARLAGVVRTAAGRPATNACVVFFPPDPSVWSTTGRSGLAWVDNRGAFHVASISLSGLPAGDYLLAALPAAQASRWRDPAFLASAARVATRVTVGWDEEKTQDLVLQEDIK